MTHPLGASTPAPHTPQHSLFDLHDRRLAIRLLQKCIGLPKLNQVYERSLKEKRHGESIFPAMLRVLQLELAVSELDLERIPKSGPVVVVANHPFGMIEGVLVSTLLERVRPDFRIMANSLLSTFPEVAARCILVDPFGGEEAARANQQGLRESVAWLRQGKMLVVFPAGEVSSFDPRQRVVIDPAWSKSVARIIALTKAPVIPLFFAGRNSLLFQIAGMIHPRLRTALLAREFLNKTGKKFPLRVGNLVSCKKLESFAGDQERIDYLRRKTYVLANRTESKPPLPFLIKTKSKTASAPHEQEPIVAATDPLLMEREIHSLPSEALLDRQSEQDVYIAEANSIPNVVREIGRLREITFRETGEGTGKSIDLDEFDSYYLHLFIWNRSTREIIGAYRLGQSDLILRTLGKKGFYTRTLFAYRRAFLERISPALEMGRSFVRKEYQRSYGPLLLLWKGIGTYVVRSPKYKILFGPVSISNDYHPNSRQLIVNFLKEYCKAKDLARLVRARSPFRTRPIQGWEGETENGMVWDIEELSALIADIETDQKGVPILLKQYLKLGGKLLSFNIDAHFSNALDGLIVVDLLKTDPRLLERYMGKEGIAAFLAHHQQQTAQAK